MHKENNGKQEQVGMSSKQSTTTQQQLDVLRADFDTFRTQQRASQESLRTAITIVEALFSPNTEKELAFIEKLADQAEYADIMDTKATAAVERARLAFPKILKGRELLKKRPVDFGEIMERELQLTGNKRPRVAVKKTD